METLLKNTSPQLEKAVAYIKSADVAQYRRMIGVLAKAHRAIANKFGKGACEWHSVVLNVVKEMTRGVELSDGRSHFRNGCIVVRDAMPRLTPPTN